MKIRGSHMGYKACRGAAALVALTVALLPNAHARELSLEDLVKAQKAIEEVYWRHRIWPKENPRPKPPLEVVMPEDAIRAKVKDYLRKSNALGALWGRPVTSEQLQAEVDRMARDTRDPELLRELFNALGNDPYLIASALARETLVERLLPELYAWNTRLHEALRAEAGENLKTRGEELSHAAFSFHRW